MLLTEQDFDRHTAALAPEAGYLVDDPIVLCDGAELGELAGDVPTAATGFGKYDELSVLGTGTPHGNPDGEWFTQRIWRFGSDAAAADFVTAAEAAFACGSWTADPTRPDLSSNVLAAAPAAGLGDGGFAVVKARGPIVTTYEVVRLGPVVTLVTDSLVVAEGRVPSGDELLGDEVRVGLACTASRRIADAGRPIVGHDVEMSACDPSPTTSAPAGPTTAESTTSAAPPASLAP